MELGWKRMTKFYSEEVLVRGRAWLTVLGPACSDLISFQFNMISYYIGRCFLQLKVGVLSSERVFVKLLVVRYHSAIPMTERNWS